ncbi:hypothetical protein J8273_1018 [Carpediemonas membranifera]|uniref:WH2 domain-containing protein n=1 Tax=Carpediemonas membranifera TaxID=201153 RepID=A0A8J6B2P6_9EUKA|nr:hypothetical protein J8273_1018 [Carpediemonas membranifera]|eukprot:KAG9397110.1 hypothetical protein J8273_1018 [Carpediemonas membranifera]
MSSLPAQIDPSTPSSLVGKQNASADDCSDETQAALAKLMPELLAYQNAGALVQLNRAIGGKKRKNSWEARRIGFKHEMHDISKALTPKLFKKTKKSKNGKSKTKRGTSHHHSKKKSKKPSLGKTLVPNKMLRQMIKNALQVQKPAEWSEADWKAEQDVLKQRLEELEDLLKTTIDSAKPKKPVDVDVEQDKPVNTPSAAPKAAPAAPAPPPPPPMPTTMPAAQTPKRPPMPFSVNELNSAIKQRSERAGHQRSVSSPQVGTPSLLDSIRLGVTLRRTNGQRSPGGTPIKAPVENSIDNDLAKALARRLQAMNPDMSDDSDDEGWSDDSGSESVEAESEADPSDSDAFYSCEEDEF